MKKERAVDWQQLLQTLQLHVPAGRVTTYGRCSQWAFKHEGGGPAVARMLDAIARRGHQRLTNRVVQNDGGVADRPDGEYGQRDQLQAEDVPFDAGGRVDLRRCRPVEM